MHSEVLFEAVKLCAPVLCRTATTAAGARGPRTRGGRPPTVYTGDPDMDLYNLGTETRREETGAQVVK